PRRKPSPDNDSRPHTLRTTLSFASCALFCALRKVGNPEGFQVASRPSRSNQRFERLAVSECYHRDWQKTSSSRLFFQRNFHSQQAPFGACVCAAALSFPPRTEPCERR